MNHHPDQMMTMATINMQEMQAETARWRLATVVLKAQQATSQDQPSQFDTLRTWISQFVHKLARPTWEAVVKHG